MARTSQQINVQPGEVEVNPTLWGYVVRSGRRGVFRGGVAGAIRTVLGAGAGLIALGQWALPNSLIDPGVLALKLGATVFLGAIAIMFLWRRADIVVREVQVDMNRSELSAGFRTRRGFVLEAQVGFEEISTVALMNCDNAEGCMLVCQLAGREAGLVIAEAPHHKLSVLTERMARDLGAVQAGFNPVAQATGKSGPLVLGPRLELAVA